jgi:hypothetical protein
MSNLIRLKKNGASSWPKDEYVLFIIKSLNILTILDMDG